MKPIYLTFIFSALLLLCCKPNNSVIIIGELKGYDNSAPISYQVSPSYRTMDLHDTIFADHDISNRTCTSS